MKYTPSRFFAYLGIQLRMLFVQWRWLLPLPVMAVIGYMMINYLQKYQLPEFLQQSGQVSQINAWDALFISFGNAHYMTFVIANLFLILVFDTLPEPSFGQLSLFRLRSRSAWWLSKVLAILAAAFVYTLICILIIVGMAAIKFPISFSWSPWTESYPANALLPNFVVNTMSLPAVVISMFFLGVLGFWAIGLLALVVTMFTQKYLYGYFASLIILIGSFSLCGSVVNSPDWIKMLPIQHNLCLTMYPYPVRDIGLEWSFLYWAIFLTGLISAGFITAKRQDHFSQQQ